VLTGIGADSGVMIWTDLAGGALLGIFWAGASFGAGIGSALPAGAGAVAGAAPQSLQAVVSQQLLVRWKRPRSRPPKLPQPQLSWLVPQELQAGAGAGQQGFGAGAQHFGAGAAHVSQLPQLS